MFANYDRTRMETKFRVSVVVAISILILICSGAGSADTTAAASTPENALSGHPGTHSLGVGVSSGGDALENVPVTVVNKKTGDKVFSGFTDSAGQIDVTLPQGQYDVVVQGHPSLAKRQTA